MRESDEDSFKHQKRKRRKVRDSNKSPLWFEDEAAGWMVPGDLLKRNS